ncbi:TPM domain-containing protein [Phenylobacterium sp. J426]|uniref:TPM domain-containing protein n=1 Tax=Phenylobacterium sp. J426 TaxID=2898439 RepID=UPI002150FD60|nr:TPM domain-containing protein [Phenylobacterium sp. J426]MCR5874479.1 TPM domain-containing protein [Phenylobacterium sp. J426]
MSRFAGARGLVLALLMFLVPAGVVAQPKFPPLTGRVVDNANLISPQVEQELDQKLAGLEQSTGRQVVVATLPDLQGYEIEEYGYQLGRAWGIGSKERDDGALLIVAPNERKVRIEVGYGLEGVLTDALSSVIIQTAILPQFREGRFEQGIVAGTDQLVRQLSLPDEEARANVAQAQQAQAARASGGGSAIPVIFVMIVIFWILSGILGAFGGRGRRRRGGGMWWLLPLILSSGGGRHRGGGWGGGGGFGGGGFGGGGGSFGGGGSSGSW